MGVRILHLRILAYVSVLVATLICTSAAAAVAGASSIYPRDRGVPDAMGRESRLPQVRVTVAQQLTTLKLINYFPRAHSWRGMWTEWEPTTLAADFQMIAALHANAVRITVFPDTFGYPQPNAVMQARLAELVVLANRAGLKVQLSIFDQFKAWTDVIGSKTWARSLLTPYANDPRIAFIDVRNELDPDDAAQVSWARRMIPCVKSIVGSTLVTVSKSGGGAPAALRKLKSQLAPIAPDFWDWHYYGVEGLAYGFFERAAAIAAPQPLYIGETGLATWPSRNGINGVPVSTQAYEEYQSYYFRVIAAAATHLGLPPVAPWMLWDLDPAGAPPQPNQSEYHFGLFRIDGSAKPAAGVIADYFAGRPISQDVNYSLSATVENGLGDTFAALWRIGRFSGNVGCGSAVTHGGRGSVWMSQTGGDSSGAPQIWSVPVDPHVAPGQTITASVWARGAQATGLSRLAIAFFDQSGVYCGQIESQSLAAGTGSWYRLAAVGRAPARANYVRLYLKSSRNAGTVWFADITYGGS